NLGEIGEAGARLPQLAKLRQRDHELKKRLRSLKKRRKVWDVAYMAGIVAVLACSVILALAVSPATAAIAAATASATAMKVVEPLFSSVWNRWEGSLQEEKDVVAAMRKMRELAVHELENVRLTFEKLKIDIDAMLDRVDFVIGGEEEEMAVRIGILSGHIMAREVEKGIDGLKDNFDSCSDKIRKAATEFLKMIMKDI
uniref:UPF0496 protein At5g66675-like n=1 Tax=Elaeis guineensis var. tenera TaxID=51953 RepID=A0A6I9S7K3_ELAGV